MGRGKAKMNFLREIQPNQRLPVELGPVQNGVITPIGKNGKFMCKYVTHLSKDGNKLPLTVHDWKYMSSEFIENCILEVKQIFDVPDELINWIKLKLNERWRNYKHILKLDAYNKWPTLEQRLANPPKDVVESQWRVLVDVWETDEKKKEISEKNKENRSKQTNLHTTGSRSHATYAVELAKELGRPPKRYELYAVTHTRKRKTEDPNEVLMDPEVAAEIKEMEEVEYQASQPGSHIVLQGRNDSFAHVKGRDKGGRVRCLGSAVKPKQYWGEESSSQATNDPNVEIVNLRQQLEVTIGNLQAAMKRISELEAQLATRDEIGTSNGPLQEALKKIAELQEEVESLKMVQDFSIGDMLRT